VVWTRLSGGDIAAVFFIQTLMLSIVVGAGVLLQSRRFDLDEGGSDEDEASNARLQRSVTGGKGLLVSWRNTVWLKPNHKVVGERFMLRWAHAETADWLQWNQKQSPLLAGNNSALFRLCE
jgi:hypothetical protein